MTLSQSAVSELLEAFRTGEGVDLVRESVRMVMQQLIEAEATERIVLPGHDLSSLASWSSSRTGTGCSGTAGALMFPIGERSSSPSLTSHRNSCCRLRYCFAVAAGDTRSFMSPR
jgi:hypothetical protein